MKKELGKRNYTLKKIHENMNLSHGYIHFTINELIVSCYVGTPNFNDYGVWNIYEIEINYYDSEGYNVKLKPGRELEIEISEEEFKSLISHFGTSVEFINEVNGEYNNFLPYPFCEAAVLTYGINQNQEEIVFNNKTNDWDCIEKYLNGEENDFPLFRILIPIMKHVKENYNKEQIL